MYLMFLVPHPNTPLATYDFVVSALLKGDWLSLVTAFSLVLLLLLHIYTLNFWFGIQNSLIYIRNQKIMKIY